MRGRPRTQKKDGDEEITETDELGEIAFEEGFSIKGGETKEIDFEVNYLLDEKMANMGGVAGAVGKLGSFAMGKSDSYSLVASCDVKGTVLDPSATEELKVGKKES